MKFFVSFLLLMFPFSVFATDAGSEFKTVEEMMAERQGIKETKCASQIFAQSLKNNARLIREDADTEAVKLWAQSAMMDGPVLEKILQCDEVKNTPDTETVIFTPVVYEFPNKRTITVNYMTQPKVLKQKFILASKPSLPTNNPNPKLMETDFERNPIEAAAKYINTDPAWYAIMVVQHDALKDFVGPNKNNTVSIKWLNNNISKVYPKGYWCTSRSAWANDKDTINQVVHQVADFEDDTNDYYVAGDINLGWVMYAELFADAVLTIATLGGNQAILGSMRAAKATRIASKTAKNMRNLRRFARVKSFSKTANNATRTARQIERLEKTTKYAKEYEAALKAGKTSKADDILKAAKNVDPTITPDKLKDAGKMEDTLNTLRKELPKIQDEMAEIVENANKQIKDKKNLLKRLRKEVDPEDVKDYDKKLKKLNKLYDAKTTASPEKVAEIQKSITELEDDLKWLEKNAGLGEYGKVKRDIEELEGVVNYSKNADALKDMLNYTAMIKAGLRPQTGNIVTKPLRKVKDLYKSAKAINGIKYNFKMLKANRIARAGMSSFSSKAADWLFHTSMRFGEKLIRFEQKVTLAAEGLYFLLDMYDYTSDVSKEFSNGIEFKPFCLLSADDIPGEENVVNYGTWLKWMGNSTSQEDDDAAYLQAMDFAAKFHYTLDNFQEENTPECNVDIYVVRPIIRLNESNPNKITGDMFYLVMNDTPWTTAEQFMAANPNIAQWEQRQEQLRRENPKQQFAKPAQEEDEDENLEEEQPEDNTQTTVTE